MSGNKFELTNAKLQKRGILEQRPVGGKKKDVDKPFELLHLRYYKQPPTWSRWSRYATREQAQVVIEKYVRMYIGWRVGYTEEQERAKWRIEGPQS